MKNGKIYKVLILLGIIVLPVLVKADVTLPRLVSDNMILQRDQQVNIWGWALPGEEVIVQFNNKTATAKTGADKKWRITLPAMKAGGPYNMTIKAGNTLIIKNILIGDVWLCSGQSNMEFQMIKVKDRYSQDIAAAGNYPIREFYVKPHYSFTPLADVDGTWKLADPETVLRFSAVGYFFAQNLYQKYQVPIGIIHSSWPGSPAEAWISREGLKDFPNYIATADKFKDTAYAASVVRKDKQVAADWYANIQKNDAGFNAQGKSWAGNDIDLSDWKTLKFPGFWDTQSTGNIDGVVWVKKTINVPAAMLNKDSYLELGLIDDIDTTYINGQKVGFNNSKYSLRKYKVPAGLLKEGANTITIRIIDNEGQGGIGKGKIYRLTDGVNSIDLSGEWLYKIGYVSPPLPVRTFTRIEFTPGVAYNGMIDPITPYTIKGVAWYQGEANASKFKAPEYRRLLPAMITEWRNKWNQPSLPFLIVQLPNFMQPSAEPAEGDWAVLRESQSIIAGTVPDCGMAVTIDLGEADDIHPSNKKDVGMRLALVAAKVAYKDNREVSTGPVYQSMVVEGDKIILSFAGSRSKLTARNGDLNQFAIAGNDKRFVWAKAKIEGNKIVVWSDSVAHPVAVRYAWANNPAGCNLYNQSGLPASPFRTDDWTN